MGKDFEVLAGGGGGLAAALEKGLRKQLYVVLGGVGGWLALVVKRVLDLPRRR